jgi:hypothetical protein
VEDAARRPKNRRKDEAGVARAEATCCCGAAVAALEGRGGGRMAARDEEECNRRFAPSRTRVARLLRTNGAAEDVRERAGRRMTDSGTGADGRDEEGLERNKQRERCATKGGRAAVTRNKSQHERCVRMCLCTSGIRTVHAASVANQPKPHGLQPHRERQRAGRIRSQMSMRSLVSLPPPLCIGCECLAQSHQSCVGWLSKRAGGVELRGAGAHGNTTAGTPRGER